MSAVMPLRYPLGVLLAAFLAFAGPSGGAGLLRPAPELRVPSGYTAQRYATGLSRPTAMAFGPDGRLYVAQETGQIVVVGVAVRSRACSLAGSTNRSGSPGAALASSSPRAGAWTA